MRKIINFFSKMLSTRTFGWCLVLIAILFFYIMNVIVPYYADDLSFMVSPFDKFTKISSISEAFDTAILMYLKWNGRFWPNFLGRGLVALCSDGVFNIINTLFFAITVLLAIKYVFKSIKKANFVGISIIIIGLFFINKNNIFYWAIGSANYLFPIPMLLILLIIYESIASNNEPKFSWLSLPLGLVCCMGHEIYTIPLAGALGIYYLMNRRKINKPIVFLCLGVFIASLLIVFCPGNLYRLSLSEQAAGSTSIFITLLKSTVYTLTRDLRFFYVLLMVNIFYFIKNKDRLLLFVKDNAVLYLFTVVAILFPIIANAHGRAIMAAEISSVLLLGLFFKDFQYRSVKVVLSFSLIFILMFQIWIINVSRTNWGIYKNMLSDYISNTSSPVVYIDDSKLIDSKCQYTIDLNNFLFWKRSMAEYKAVYTGKEEGWPEVRLMSCVKYFENHDSFDGVNRNGLFYDDSQLNYYFIPYEDANYNKIESGDLRIILNFVFMPIVKYERNVDPHDIVEGPVMVSEYSNKVYILFKKNYGELPFTKVQSIEL